MIHGTHNALEDVRNEHVQIFINDEPFGGYDDIVALNREGELDQKLGI